MLKPALYFKGLRSANVWKIICGLMLSVTGLCFADSSFADNGFADSSFADNSFADIVDPTKPLDYQGKSRVSNPSANGDLTLQSILFSDTRRVAIINGNVVGEGDQIAGTGGNTKVTRITSNEVEVVIAGKSQRLQLPETAVKSKTRTSAQ